LGLSDSDLNLVNALMEYNFGWANLVATFSHINSGTVYAVPQAPVFTRPWSSLLPSGHHEKSGEVRLTTNLDGAWNFIGGLYAEDLDDNFSQNFYWFGNPPNILGGTARFLGLDEETRNLKQKSAFGEASWKCLPKFTLTAGIRAYDYD